MQTIAQHKKEVHPSDMTLNWCVDIVKACGKRISAMSLLANTRINHVSVANDAYEQLQTQLGRGPTDSGLSPTSDGIDLYSYDPHPSISRRSPSSPSSNGNSAMALTVKERRRVLRVEAARAMLQEVSAYIQLRLAEEESKVGRAAASGNYLDDHRKDPHYELYRALGTMHHWLLADDQLPSETREQQRLMNIDDRNVRDSRQGQASIAALLVDKREVPAYSYGALLQLITETDVGLLGAEIFPFEVLSPVALKKLATSQIAPCYASEGVEGCDAFIDILTPPPLPEIAPGEASSPPSRSRPASTPSTPRARSLAASSPSDQLTPYFLHQLQSHLVNIFTVWARAMTTYFLHCELLDDLERQQMKAQRDAERRQLELAQQEEEQRIAELELVEQRRREKAEKDRRATEEAEYLKREKEAQEQERRQNERRRQEEAAEADRLRLIQQQIDADAAMKEAQLHQEVEAERRRKLVRRQRDDEEEMQRQWQREREEQEEAHRQSLAEAARKRDAELARLEAERLRIASEDRALEEARKRQANLKSQLAEEEEAAKRLAASLAAQRRKQAEAEAADRIRRKLEQDEEDRKRREEVAAAERQLQEQEETTKRRKAVFTRVKRIEDTMADTEHTEEASDRGRISLEEGADREWLSTLEVKEYRASQAREREAKAKREEEELKHHQKALAQAEERMRYRAAKQRADDLERAQREAELRQRLEVVHQQERSDFQTLLEHPPRLTILASENDSRRDALAKHKAERAVAEQQEQERNRQEAEAVRRAKELDLVRRVREAELKRLKEEEAERLRLEQLREEQLQQEMEAERLRKEEEEESIAQENRKRNKAARPAPPAQRALIAHDGVSSDEDQDDLRRRVTALERENKYLCEVVDGINTSHIRLHRHVLEVEENSRSPSANRMDVGLVSQTAVRNRAPELLSGTGCGPASADDLPLPKSEELAVPRRASTSPQRRKASNPNEQRFVSPGRTIANGGSPAHRHNPSSIADRIRQEVATHRPAGYEGLNASARSPQVPMSTDQIAAERDQRGKLEALYARQPSPPTGVESRPSRPSTATTRSGNPANLGGWNMYDQGGFSGAVGYTYDPQELDAPYLAIAANAPSWMHPKDLQIAREDHLRRIQRAMFGDQLGTDGYASHTITDSDAQLLFTEEELGIAQERQRYEVRVVQQLLREIRLRGGLTPLASDGDRSQPKGFRQSYSAPIPPSMLFLPEPCVKIDFGALSPWITDTHLLLILNSLLDSAKHLASGCTAPVSGADSARPSSAAYSNAAQYPKSNALSAEALTANVAATIRAIDISRCTYVTSESVLYLLIDLARLCPNLQHVSVNKSKFGRQGQVPSPQATAIGSPNKSGYLTTDAIEVLENTLAARAIEASRIR